MSRYESDEAKASEAADTLFSALIYGHDEDGYWEQHMLDGIDGVTDDQIKMNIDTEASIIAFFIVQLGIVTQGQLFSHY